MLSVVIVDFDTLTAHGSVHRTLAAGMAVDRRRQFAERQGWHIRIMGDYELDDYDTIDVNPVYVLAGSTDPHGRMVHIGSARLLPSTGKTMIEDVFDGMIDPEKVPADQPIYDESCWEVTRMVISPDAAPHLQALAAPLVLYAGNELFMSMGVKRCVAAFSKKMLGVYKRLGNPPQVIGGGPMGGDDVLLGIFPCDEGLRQRLQTRLESPQETHEAVRQAVAEFHETQTQRATETAVVAGQHGE